MQDEDDHAGHAHAHGHGHTHAHEGSHLDEMDLRVRALESLLTEKGYIDPAALDVFIETYETKIGPRNGARVVAKAWSDPDYRGWLMRDATAAIASLGFTGRQGEHMVAVENTPDTHNLVVCTLCSCYPWSVLGLPPVWYKSPPYRSRAVIDPRGVLAEFGVTLPEATRIRVWDSTAEIRYLVVPMRPAGSEGVSEEELAGLVTRDSMIGAGLPLARTARVNGPHDLGGSHGFGPVRQKSDEPLFHASWERRAFALTLAMGATGAWNLDMSRHARERIPPAEYLASSYYEIWLKGMQRLLVERGLATAEEIAAGRSLRAPADVPRKPLAGQIAGLLAKGGPTDRGAVAPAGFAPGDRVRAKIMHPAGHTRLPRYVRGRSGRIERVHGVFVLPDANAHGEGEDPRWLYSVVFEARELWGPQAAASDEIVLDLWEPYLEPG